MVLTTPLPTGLDDLARAARDGDRHAFGQLVSRVARPLQRFLVVRTSCTHDAEELTQETLLRTWEQLERYEPGRPVLPWIYTIARHLALSRQRAEARRPSSHLNQDPESGELCPAEAGARAEQAHGLWSLAARVLGEEQRSALWMHYVDGLPAAEIGRVLGRRSSSVRVLLFRARRTLARHLPEPEGVAAPLPPLHTAPTTEGV